MKLLRNCWYMIGWGSEIAPGGTLTRVVADEPIRVERRDDGQVAARSEAAGNRDIAILDKHRILWIWLGQASDSDPSRVPDFSFYDDVKETAFFCGYLPTEANYELMSDNILDLSHADFLHYDTLGGGAITRTAPAIKPVGDSLSVIWDARNEVALPVFNRLLPQPGQRADTQLAVTWNPPATMALRVRTAPAGEPFEQWFEAHSAHIMTPESEFRTHYFYGNLRNYKTDDAEFNALQAKLIGAVFAREDKPLIEAQQRNMGQSDLWSLNPVLLRIDAGAVQARRLLARLMDREQSEVRTVP